MEPRNRKWNMNKANYYFPKIDRYPDLKTATLVFVASSFGLIVLISALIILLYRMGSRARQQRELQSRLQTISELLGIMLIIYICSLISPGSSILSHPQTDQSSILQIAQELTRSQSRTILQSMKLHRATMKW